MSDDEKETPHWFEVVLFYIKSMLAGLGMVTAIFAGCYWWAVK